MGLAGWPERPGLGRQNSETAREVTHPVQRLARGGEAVNLSFSGSQAPLQFSRLGTVVVAHFSPSYADEG